jgi:cytoskeletal protein CcmA (bactofilin family)
MIGNIHSPSVFIDRGVEFQGSCRMDPVDETREAATKADKGDKAEKAPREGSKAPPVPQPRA